MADEKVVTIHDRIPKLKEQRRQKANRKLIYFLSIFFILIMIIIYSQSPLSHVRSIEVNGNEYVKDETIIQQSGISNQTNLWSINKSDTIKKIEEMDEIVSAELKRKFFNNVEITIVEYNRIAYLYEGGTGVYHPIIETGTFIEELSRDEYPVDAPILINWEQGNLLEELANELKMVPKAIMNRISEIHHIPEESDPYRIMLFMNDGHRVHSTVQNFSGRVSSYPAIVREVEPNKKGIIHMRMTPYFELVEEEKKRESEG